ncbi:hypothetical protein [Saccharomonospora iraqiensis]|uniref:hypothetical protein n=1 Tax=Saccharomonospora iraqiensis TaxID=52698 RepID=UPI00022DF530|nr:hypothetical protein [Saccharomonospora iraqiensis]
MRKSLIAPLGALAALAFVTPASAQDQSGELPGEVNTWINVHECAETEAGTKVATVVFENSTEHTFFGDYRIGDEEGTPDDATGQEITEGPRAGQEFGPVYNQVEIPAGSADGDEVRVHLELGDELTEDQGAGSVTISSWVERGPEQKNFTTNREKEATTDCAEEDPTPSSNPSPDPSQPTEPTDPGGQDPVYDCDSLTREEAQDILNEDTSDPHGLDGNGNGLACEDDEDPSDDELPGDEPDENGKAPKPVPQPGHLPVTG